MTLGIDSKLRLDQNTNIWHQFLTAWGQQPTFVGRYFGDVIPGTQAEGAWKPGELLKLRTASALAQSIRFVFPFAPPGPFESLRPANLSQHNQQSSIVFFRQQGEERNLVAGQVKRLTAKNVRKHGRIDANATCEQIAAALSFVDPGSNQPELVLPDSETVFVFLDIEPQTGLSPDYWLGWAETVSSFTITKTTAIGTVVLVQPFRPCLYGVVREDPINALRGFPADTPGPWPEITRAFPLAEAISVRIRSKHPCYALATPWPFDSFNVADAIAATEADVQAQWEVYGMLRQPVGPDAPVVIWQYRINIGMDVHGNFFDTEELGAPVAVFDIDLNATSSAPYNGRPITDYMLRRP